MSSKFASILVILTTTVVSGCINDTSDSGSSVNEGSLLPGTVMRTSAFDESEQCPAGGVLIELGTDTNKDGTLQDSEVEQSQEICNGVSGTDGVDGVNGADGHNSVIEVFAVLPGHETCEYGGTQIDVGLDDGSGGIVWQSEFICRPTPDCTWQDNGDGTITVTCEGEDPYLLLAQSSLEFTESIRCNVFINKAGSGGSVQIPLSYTIDKIGEYLKHVSLTVYDGGSQFTNSRLLSSGQVTIVDGVPLDIFDEAFINVFYDNYQNENGGRFYAYLNKTSDLVYFVYQDPDLIDPVNNPNGAIGGSFPAFDPDPNNAVCNKILPD